MNLYAPLGLLLLSAPFGLFLAVRHLRAQDAPFGVAIVHGLFAASGLAVLAFLCYQSGWSGKAVIALGALVAAALGGFVLVSARLRAARPAAYLIAAHALVALSGVGILLLAALGR